MENRLPNRKPTTVFRAWGRQRSLRGFAELGAATVFAWTTAWVPVDADAQVIGVVLNVVAATGDPAADGDGLYNLFQQPTINDLGEVAFSSTFSDSFNPAGVSVAQTTGLEIVARANDPAPDGNGVLFGFGLGPVPINASGQVSFTSSL